MAGVAELLANGVLWLNEQMFAPNADLVTYRRGTDTVEIPRAINAGQIFKVQDSGGVRIERSDREYAVLGKTLVLSGERTEPQRGDQIVDAHEEDGLTHVYEVLSLPHGEQSWRWDPLRLSLVIHTKHVGTE